MSGATNDLWFVISGYPFQSGNGILSDMLPPDPPGDRNGIPLELAGRSPV